MKDINKKNNDKVQVVIINITTLMLIVIAMVLIFANYSTSITDDDLYAYSGETSAYQSNISNEIGGDKYINIEATESDDNKQIDNVEMTDNNAEEVTTENVVVETTQQHVQEETTSNILEVEVVPNDNGTHGNCQGAGILNRTDKVDDNYFDNVVFLGDSRTVALEELGLISPNNSFSVIGINHIDYMSRVFYDNVTGVTGTIFDIISVRQPEKIYVALGINGVAFIPKDRFLETYIEMLERLMIASPNSKIVIESILPVNEATYKRGNPAMNNANVDDINRELINIAYIKGLYYLDIASVLKNENNRLADQYDSGDGIHFTNAGYNVLFNEMCYYGVDR